VADITLPLLDANALHTQWDVLVSRYYKSEDSNSCVLHLAATLLAGICDRRLGRFSILGTGAYLALACFAPRSGKHDETPTRALNSYFRVVVYESIVSNDLGIFHKLRSSTWRTCERLVFPFTFLALRLILYTLVASSLAKLFRDSIERWHPHAVSYGESVDD
jgi:hypothetical protein